MKVQPSATTLLLPSCCQHSQQQIHPLFPPPHVEQAAHMRVQAPALTVAFTTLRIHEGTGPCPHEGTGPGPHEVQALPQQKQKTAKIDITNQCCSMSERGEEMESHPCSHYSAVGPSRYQHPQQQVPCTGGFPPSVWDLKLK